MSVCEVAGGAPGGRGAGGTRGRGDVAPGGGPATCSRDTGEPSVGAAGYMGEWAAPLLHAPLLLPRWGPSGDVAGHRVPGVPAPRKQPAARPPCCLPASRAPLPSTSVSSALWCHLRSPRPAPPWAALAVPGPANPPPCPQAHPRRQL